VRLPVGILTGIFQWHLHSILCVTFIFRWLRHAQYPEFVAVEWPVSPKYISVENNSINIRFQSRYLRDLLPFHHFSPSFHRAGIMWILGTTVRLLPCVIQIICSVGILVKPPESDLSAQKGQSIRRRSSMETSDGFAAAQIF
jgi:hypothetical protein